MGPYLVSAMSVLVLAHLAFLLAVRMKRNDIADVVWSLGFLVAGFASFLWRGIETHAWFEIDEQWDWRLIVSFACLTIWALRLSVHVATRNFKHSIEDSRYKKWREEWGAGWKLRSYLQVFVLQALILIVNVLPMIKIGSTPSVSLDAAFFLGLAVWILGFSFEAIGDRQLKVFKSDSANKGKLMTTGLWSWSRHPNYFGEVTQWWGFFLMAVGLPGAWFTIAGPITITFLILKVSGVPMLESAMESRPGFAEYKRRTSTFFPLPPKR